MIAGNLDPSQCFGWIVQAFKMYAEGLDKTGLSVVVKPSTYMFGLTSDRKMVTEIAHVDGHHSAGYVRVNTTFRLVDKIDLVLIKGWVWSQSAFVGAIST